MVQGRWQNPRRQAQFEALRQGWIEDAGGAYGYRLTSSGALLASWR